MKTLFPLLPQTPSSQLRIFIRKTILNDIKTANLRTKNHKLNNAVQAILFGMIERGLGAEFAGDKGKTKVTPAGAGGDEAMWAIILAKELWRKGIWRDAKTVAIISQGCFHPVVKAQSASLHFFLGDEEDADDSDEEEEVRLKHPHIVHILSHSFRLLTSEAFTTNERSTRRLAEATPVFRGSSTKPRKNSKRSP